MNMKIFGIRVKQELKQQGKTQTALAKHLNVQKSTVSEWLNDNNEPPMECIVKIALFLNVTTDYLLGLEDEGEGKIKNTYYNSGIHIGNIDLR